MTDIKLATGLFGLDGFFGGDLDELLAIAQYAEDLGLDQIVITDHVVMGENTHNYPYGDFPAPLDFPWYEPMVLLSALSAATETIRLATGILIGPLRSAALLAKQIATLDVLSKGRTDIGLGTGWQREEYDASGIPWEQRGRYLREQVAAMRVLWSEAPASFNGELVKFSATHSRPFPTQGRDTPLWFGLAPTPYNCRLIAAEGTGWLPMAVEPEDLREGIAKVHEAMDAIGRDPAELAVRTMMKPGFDNNGPNLDMALENAAAQIEAGVTVLTIEPGMYCQGPDDIAAVLQRFATLKQ